MKDTAINYPTTVDEKTLWALVMTGDAIIRNPKSDRIEHWKKLRAILAEQCKQTAKMKATPNLSPAAVKAAEGIYESIQQHNRGRGNYVEFPFPKDIAAIISRHFAPLVEVAEAAEKVVEGFERGVFVRDTSNDHKPGWSVKLLPFIAALGRLKAASDEALEGKK